MKTSTLTAKEIRKDLKQAFPGIKFSVTSESFANGDSVNVTYPMGKGIDGKMVSDVVSKYQYGSFNSMEDIYENTNMKDDIPQVKYIMIQKQY